MEGLAEKGQFHGEIGSLTLLALTSYFTPVQFDAPPSEHQREMTKLATHALQPIAESAQSAGVDCDTDFVMSNQPYEAIIDAAHKHGCDLIFMASHGRSGLSALIHGSETKGVLTGSKIPTLVYR